MMTLDDLPVLRSLPSSDPDFPEPEIYRSISFIEKYVEQAGEAHMIYSMKKMGLYDDPEKNSEEDNEDAEGDDANPDGAFDKSKLDGKKKKKVVKEGGSYNDKSYYEALGLGHLGFQATERDIKLAHRSMVLKYHPDKFETGAYDEAAKQRWLTIQAAYETLVDPEKRKKYDAQMDFDDFIPEDKSYTSAEFFEIFTPVFKRNAYYSTVQPSPEIGDASTNIKKVLKFYDFWNAFKSWRDFTHEDEYDLEQAENRWERRHMEKENKKMKAPLYKKEKARIARLVERASKNDPRIKKHEKEEREAKEARLKQIEERKQQEKEKKEALVKQREDEIRAKEEAEQSRLQAIENEKKKKLEESSNRKKTVSALVSEKVKLPQYSEQFFNLFLDKVTTEEYEAMIQLLTRDDLQLSAMQAEFSALIQTIKDRQRGITQKAPEQKEEVSVAEMLKGWTTKEMQDLTLAFSKYPAGVARRWENIAEFIGGNKEVAEVIQMAKKLSIQNMKGSKALERKIDQVIKAKNEFEAKATVKAQTVKQPEPEPAQDAGSVWSQAEQDLLQKALKMFPSTMEKKERWAKIAEVVITKNAKDCFQRVKDIKAKLAAKKADSQSESPISQN